MNTTRREILLSAIAVPALVQGAKAQTGAPVSEAIVDAEGVMRWRADGKEVNLFGVNYALASASAYRFVKRTGAPLRDAIHRDMSHFQRMGLNALRLGFWGDWENSDGKGNLIENEHLLALDETLVQCAQRGMRVMLSPIITYDASWPDDMKRPKKGISVTYQKSELGLDGAAIAAQVNYLRQLLERRNSITNIAYKDDPAIFAIEPINEPYHHPDQYEASVRYVNTLCEAIRGTGCQKLVLFNVSQDMKMAPILANTKIDGTLFAWYPTGLQAGREVHGNHLLLVDDYAQMRDPSLKAKAKLIYEYDAPDYMGSYMYPAMARAFRRGGAQFAAMFSYDPVMIASGNLEFNDHYLNLAYTPAKAVSFLIAREAFQQIPRGSDFGSFPQNMQFGPFRVDDEANRSELVSDELFYYSNDTQSVPPAKAKLKRVVGCGVSPLIEYDGTGSYFLDKVADGIWRLELYPDAAIVDNPFDQQHLGRTVSQIVWRSRKMRLALPDLGSSFTAEPAAGGQPLSVNDGTFLVSPGVYVLRRKGITSRPSIDTEYFAPPAELFDPVMLHEAPSALPSQAPWTCRAEYVSMSAPEAVVLHVRMSEGYFKSVPMVEGRGFLFSAVVAGVDLPESVLDYFISVQTREGITTYPNLIGIQPGAWDFPRAAHGWRCPVLSAKSPVAVFDAARDYDRLILPYRGYQPYPFISLVPGTMTDRSAVRFDGSRLETATENDVVGQLGFDHPIDLRNVHPETLKSVVVRGRSARDRPGKIEIILIERDGSAWGAPALLPNETCDVVLSLEDFKPAKAAMLPRDFPVGVNPYWLRSPNLKASATSGINLAKVQMIQFSVASRFLNPDDDARPVLEIESVTLCQSAQ